MEQGSVTKLQTPSHRQTVMKAKPKQHPHGYKGQNKRNEEIFAEYSNWINGLTEATKLLGKLDLPSLLLAKSRTTKLTQSICDFQRAFEALQSHIIEVAGGYHKGWLVQRDRVTVLLNQAKATKKATSALFELCQKDRVKLETSAAFRGRDEESKEAILDDWMDGVSSSDDEDNENSTDRESDSTRIGRSKASDTIRSFGTAGDQSRLALPNPPSNQTDMGMRLTAYSKGHSNSLNTT